MESIDEDTEKENQPGASTSQVDPNIKKTIRQNPKPNLKPLPLEKMVVSLPCPLCVDCENSSLPSQEKKILLNRAEVRAQQFVRLEQPDTDSTLHNVSVCKMPRSRKIMQRRYQ